MADSRISFTIGALDQTRAAFESVRAGFKGLENQSKTSVGAITEEFGKLKTQLMGAFSVYQVSAFAKSVLDAKISIERIGVAMESVFGAGKLSADAMSYVRNESERLGLAFQSQARDYTKLAASAKGTALEGKAVKDIFTAIAEASTALGLSADDASGSLLAISQMISKGKVSAEELRGQLGERLPGAFNIAAEAMGVTTAELDEMLKKGEVVASDFLPRFAEALRDKYSGGIAKASQSTSAELSRMQTAYFDLKVAIADTFGDGTASLIRGTTDALRGMKDMLPVIEATFARLNRHFGGFIDNWRAGARAIQNIIDVAAGRKDWRTGNAIGVQSSTSMPSLIGVTGYGASNLDELIAKRAESSLSGAKSGGKTSTASKAKTEADKARDAYQRLVEQADKFIDKANDEVSLEGMTGFRKALQDNENEYQNTIALYAGLDAAKKQELTTSALALKNMKDQQAVLKETESQRTKAVQAAKEQSQYELQMAELAKENAIKHGTFFDGAVEGYRKYKEEAITAFSAGRDAVIQMSNAMSNAMSTMFFDVITGKFENLQDAFRSLGQSIIKIFTDMLAQMIVKSMAAEASGLFSWLGGMGGIFGGLSSLFGGGAAVAGSTYTASSLGSVFSSGLMLHSGGVVGGESGGMYRLIPSAAFFGAPRYHGGLASDEYAAILRRGESVFTAGQTRALGARISNGSGDSGTQNVNITIVAADARSFSDMVKRNPSSVIKPITDALKQNQMNQQWKELLK